ncbi:hypothetical protein WA158_007215 [Blastocystis sp. Blastoise]
MDYLLDGSPQTKRSFESDYYGKRTSLESENSYQQVIEETDKEDTTPNYPFHGKYIMHELRDRFNKLRSILDTIETDLRSSLDVSIISVDSFEAISNSFFSSVELMLDEETSNYKDALSLPRIDQIEQDNEIITFQLSDHHVCYKISVSTLEQYPNSILYKLYTENKILKSNKDICIDYSTPYFATILSYINNEIVDFKKIENLDQLIDDFHYFQIDIPLCLCVLYQKHKASLFEKDDTSMIMVENEIVPSFISSIRLYTTNYKRSLNAIKPYLTYNISQNKVICSLSLAIYQILFLQQYNLIGLSSSTLAPLLDSIYKYKIKFYLSSPYLNELSKPLGTSSLLLESTRKWIDTKFIFYNFRLLWSSKVSSFGSLSIQTFIKYILNEFFNVVIVLFPKENSLKNQMLCCINNNKQDILSFDYLYFYSTSDNIGHIIQNPNIIIQNNLFSVRCLNGFQIENSFGLNDMYAQSSIGTPFLWKSITYSSIEIYVSNH